MPISLICNQRKQREQAKVRLPRLAIFKRGNLLNTVTACWWMASAFMVYYSISGLQRASPRSFGISLISSG